MCKDEEELSPPNNTVRGVLRSKQRRGGHREDRFKVTLPSEKGKYNTNPVTVKGGMVFTWTIK